MRPPHSSTQPNAAREIERSVVLASLPAIRPDGSSISELDVGFWAESNPAWSPDGSQLAFSGVGDDGDEGGIFIFDVRTSEVTRLSEGSDLTPSWSPDGDRIAFGHGVFHMRFGARRLMEIHVINADGTGEKALTNDSVIDAHPSWSPDGDLIAFSSDRSAPGDIWTMSPDGGNLTRLTDSRDVDIAPRWSPSGEEIAFTRGIVPTENMLCVMDSDGSDIRRLTDGSPSAGLMTWSPDARWIAFGGYDGERTDLYVIRSDGTSLRRVTDGDFEAYNPSWKPDDEG